MHVLSAWVGWEERVVVGGAYTTVSVFSHTHTVRCCVTQ